MSFQCTLGYTKNLLSQNLRVQSLLVRLWRKNNDVSSTNICANNLYHPVPHATSNSNIHCQVSDYVFLCRKGITAVLKGRAEIMGHRLAHRESTSGNPYKRYHIGATRCHFEKIHCQIVYYVFLCSKRSKNNKCTFSRRLE